jgi:hypothetical protein
LPPTTVENPVPGGENDVWVVMKFLHKKIVVKVFYNAKLRPLKQGCQLLPTIVPVMSQQAKVFGKIAIT